MRKTSTQKGITLIALIITIIILLILAVVTIGSIKNSNIITYAQNASTDYTAKKDEEESIISGYESLLESALEDKSITISEAQSKGVISNTSTTRVKDEYGNIVKLPAGFKITTDSNNVTEGIVIEDCTETATKGSQFVWIPVGTVYTNTTKTESKVIELNRYTFDEEGNQIKQNTNKIDDYFEYEELENSKYGNTTAKDLSGFISSAKSNGGYYIGRYEAGTETARTSVENEHTQLVVKPNMNVYNYITQAAASVLSQRMYNYNKQTNVTSDLVNSYAWDTAIVFIQTFSTDKNYSNANYSESSFTLTGANKDEYCRINDMSGNVMELSTESANSHTTSECTVVYRGGTFTKMGNVPSGNTSSREISFHTSGVGETLSFRTILYL